MKCITSFLTCMILFISAKGQNSYLQAIQQGDAAFKKQQYKKAINKYFAAQAFDPTKEDIVKEKVNNVLKEVQALKIKADLEKKKALYFLQLADSARHSTLLALNKSNKLSNAFYFYKNKFALTVSYVKSNNYSGLRYYFIDTEGNYVANLGDWDRAEPFDESMGFSKVSYKSFNYLLDTSGTKYLVAYDMRRLNQETIAFGIQSDQCFPFPSELTIPFPNVKILFVNNNVDSASKDFINFLSKTPSVFPNLTQLNLYYAGLNTLPIEIEGFKNLTKLNISSNNLRQLPMQISHLKKLETLNLEYNKLTTLPAEISELQNLEYLDLLGNDFSENERTKIKAFLPNCQIIFESHDMD